EGTLESWLGQEDFDLPALAALLKTQRLRWELATELQAPPPALANRYRSVETRLGQLEQMLVQWQQDQPIVAATLARLPQAEGVEREQALAALQQTLQVYRGFDLPLPELLRQMPAAQPEAAAARKPASAAETAAQQQELKTKLDSLAASIKAGHSRDAGKLLRRAQDFARDHHLHDPRLGELAEQLRELKSWAGFAVQPKKEELIRRMEALIEHAMDPDDKADAIHALQEEWKALGVADTTVEQPMWERFKAASDTAFEPCRLHFAQQRELRTQNHEKRVALCQQLEDYLAALPADDASIDWKQHEAILRTARKEWQQHHPGDRQRTRPLQERFNRVLDALEARLTALQERHAADKRRLIARVRELVEASDLRAACDEAKRLQQEWKGIGQAHPKADHKLWLEFRTACDALFGKREEAFKARQAERDAGTQKAEELIAAYERLATDDAAKLGTEAAHIEDAFRELALPREKSRALQQRFGEARRRFEQARRQQAESRRAEKRESVIREWEGRAAETASDEKAGQLLLDLEILLELPSPPPLQDARRERQMQRLQMKGLRRSDDETRQLLGELLKTPARSEHLPEMSARLRQVLQKTGD
ncbi:MAG: hypothetical protein K0S16_1591, partial [Moraxellaceae bacterium]|nr:hypothetical protein [Moraxellaceae bacterium]